MPGRDFPPSLPDRHIASINPDTIDTIQSPGIPELPQRPRDSNDINSQSWYHKGISRDQATVKIKRYQKVIVVYILLKSNILI